MEDYYLAENISTNVIIPTEEQQEAIELTEEMLQRLEEIDDFANGTIRSLGMYFPHELAWFMADLSIAIRINKERLQSLLNEEYKKFHF